MATMSSCLTGHPQLQTLCQHVEAGPHCLWLQVRDHACCVLCLYELWALPLRLAVGTAYNRLGPSQYARPSQGLRCACKAGKSCVHSDLSTNV